MMGEVTRRIHRFMQDHTFGFSARAIHAGTPPAPATGGAAPISQTAHVEERMAGLEGGLRAAAAVQVPA
ncbi:MAG: hypothetical protein ACYDG3_09120 [Bacillati bacterium]